MTKFSLPAYMAVYQEAGFRFTRAAVKMIWGERHPWLIRVIVDEEKRRLYFEPVRDVRDDSQVWSEEGASGHLHHRAAVQYLRKLGDERKRFPIMRDAERRLCYVEARCDPSTKKD